ncbi:MAG: N-acetylornithine carbamoyltransferase [Bacteroidetes bacterium]|nr:N-acetylornithine carbamoyltransferase [Bacteroidota bacterium]MBS1757391.1 N-acetylornithine carbamoyltransferase [Bacteroidota bacterium]
MKNFISVNDVENIDALVAKALHFKESPLANINLGKNKKIGLLFLNPSLRTRISTQIAAQNLGTEAIVFNIDKEGWALEFAEGAIMNGTTVEHVKDAAPLLGTYFNIICIRTFPSLKNRSDDYAETVINAFIKYAGVPIVSLESATLHPLQSLTDIITIKENMPEGRRPKIVLSWAPHIKPLPQCVANSFAQWINKWGQADFVITHPDGYALDTQFTEGAEISHHQEEALANADFVYVKNWSSYNNYGAMPPVTGNWMPDAKKMAITNQAKIMHCLPVRRNVELSDEVLDSPDSLVTQQGSNRVWAAQAVLAELLQSI